MKIEVELTKEQEDALREEAIAKLMKDLKYDVIVSDVSNMTDYTIICLVRDVLNARRTIRNKSMADISVRLDPRDKTDIEIIKLCLALDVAL